MMVSKFALLNNLLLASAALAVSSSQLGDHLARPGHENPQSEPISRHDSPDDVFSNAFPSDYWAGAVWSLGDGTFTFVTGTFTTPIPPGNNGAFSIWVGIDGATCKNAILQTGIEVWINNGVVTYRAWYEWYPAAASYIDDLVISAGNVITATVIATSANTGIAMIENRTTGRFVVKEVASPYTLCKRDAEWIIEDFLVNGVPVPFPNFGRVTFTLAIASDPAGSRQIYYPSGAIPYVITRNNVPLTTVSAGGDTLTIQYKV